MMFGRRKTDPNVSKVCRECGSTFKPHLRSPLQVLCSKKCSDSDKRKKRANDRLTGKSTTKVTKHPETDSPIDVDGIMIIRVMR